MSSFTHISVGLDALKQSLAKELFGISLDEAHSALICFDCKRPIENLLESANNEDYQKYKISGLCPECYDKSTKE